MQHEGKTEHDIDQLSQEAEKLITTRYKKLEIDLPGVDKKNTTRLMKVWTEFSIISGLLYYQHPHFGEVLCIPNICDASGINHRRRIFNESHITDYVGHRGITTTKATMRCRYYWSELTVDAIKMVNACHECNTSKINRQKPQGKLMPIDVPLFPAQSYNTDIIGPLPESKNGNHCVLIVVDRFSSRIFLHAHSKHTTATEMAQLFVDEICYKAGRGIPLSSFLSQCLNGSAQNGSSLQRVLSPLMEKESVTLLLSRKYCVPGSAVNKQIGKSF